MEKSVRSNLLKLIQINLDAYRGYTTAAKNANDSELSSFFNSSGLDRQNFAESLGRSLGIKDIYEDVGTEIKADLHRVWMDFKTSSNEFNAHQLLNECERGEKYALETYEKIINEHSMPADLISMVNLQYQDIQNSFEEIQKLKSKYSSEDDRRNRQTPVP